MQRQERAVELVGLDDEPRSGSPPGAAAEIGHLAADGPAGLASGRFQNPGEHCRRRGLAVRTSHRNGVFPATEPSQHGRPLDLGNTPGSGLPALDVVLRDCRRINDQFGMGEVPRVVRYADGHAALAEVTYRCALFQVGPRDLAAKLQEQPGQPSHPGAADADKMRARRKALVRAGLPRRLTLNHVSNLHWFPA